jgi:uncharacterized membrane protein
MNKQLEQVVGAWPVIAVIGVMMLALLTAFAEGYIGDVMETDISKTDKIIAMDRSIDANRALVESVNGDIEDIKASQVRLEGKLDRLIEIMLTED